MPLSENHQLEAFSVLCKELGEKEHIVAIAWTLANPVVSSAIVGIRALEHLDGIERAVELELSKEMMQRLDEMRSLTSIREERFKREKPLKRIPDKYCATKRIL